MKPWIVCAANKCENGQYLIGVRHWDQFMLEQNSSYNISSDCGNKVIQGFIDQFGNFYNRQEAWIVAEANGQIIRRVGGDTAEGGTLYSENLY
jgi:hypothetical protein